MEYAYLYQVGTYTCDANMHSRYAVLLVDIYSSLWYTAMLGSERALAI
jgi:hypothetical protein